MKNIKRQWFTLVELIVVITILAILWSIAFISLQGYSADARNSKRTSDLNSLISGITTQLAQWQSVFNFVSGTANNVPSISIAWATPSGTEYAAWTVNYSALPIKAADFKDPSANQDYIIWATTKINGKYELAASMEQWAGQRTARLVWNFNPRAATTSGTYLTGSNNTVTLTDSSKINFFALWDTVLAWWTTTTITRVSADGTTLTLGASAWTLTGTVALAVSESAGLIWTPSTTPVTSSWVVTDWGTRLPY